jgi:hypothetical protein
MQCSSWVSILGLHADGHKLNSTQVTLLLFAILTECYYYYKHLLFIIIFLGRTYYIMAASLLNLSDITSKFWTVTIFVIVDLKTIFHAQFICLFMICLLIKYHMPSSRGSLVITVKLTAKDNYYDNECNKSERNSKQSIYNWQTRKCQTKFWIHSCPHKSLRM